MTDRNLDTAAGDGDRLERLLGEFFADELPEPLRRLESPSSPVASLARGTIASQGRAAALIASAAAVVLITAALGTQSSPRPANTHVAAESDSPREGMGTIAADGAHRTAVPQPAEPARETWMEEQYNTPQGPVVQRTNIRWTEVSVVEPETGAEKDLLLPELDIEVFPIEAPGSADDARP